MQNKLYSIFSETIWKIIKITKSNSIINKLHVQKTVKTFNNSHKKHSTPCTLLEIQRSRIVFIVSAVSCSSFQNCSHFSGAVQAVKSDLRSNHEKFETVNFGDSQLLSFNKF